MVSKIKYGIRDCEMTAFKATFNKEIKKGLNLGQLFYLMRRYPLFEAYPLAHEW